MQEAKKINQEYFIGNVKATLVAEHYPGEEILDTEVKIGDQTLCWISWPKRQTFIDYLNEVIEEYRI